MNNFIYLVNQLISVLEHRARTPISVLKLEIEELTSSDCRSAELLGRQLEKLTNLFAIRLEPDIDVENFLLRAGRSQAGSWLLSELEVILALLLREGFVTVSDQRGCLFEALDTSDYVPSKAGSYSSFSECLTALDRPLAMGVVSLDIALLNMGLQTTIQIDQSLKVRISKNEKSAG